MQRLGDAGLRYGIGVSNYGPCSITLKTDMVSHRASLFEDNNVVFTVYEQKASMADAENLEQGHRATWSERQRLCVAKLAPKLHAGLAAKSFPGILLEQGKTTQDDHFVEVHVWGPLTIRSVDRIRVLRRGNRPRKVVLKDLQSELNKYKIPLAIEG